MRTSGPSMKSLLPNRTATEAFGTFSSAPSKSGGSGLPSGECRHCGHAPLVHDAPYCPKCGGDEPVEMFFLHQERSRRLIPVVVFTIVGTVFAAVFSLAALLFL